MGGSAPNNLTNGTHNDSNGLHGAASAQHPVVLDGFFELALDMICVAGYDGYFKRLNPVWSQVTGFSLEELSSEPFINFVHPDDHESTLAVAAKLADGTDVARFENRYRCKDGSYRWIEWTSRTDPANQLILAIARDITDHKAAATEALLYREVIDNMATGMNVWRLDDHDDPRSLRLLATNAAASRFSFMDMSKVLGQTFGQIYPPLLDSGLPEIYAEVARGGAARNLPDFVSADAQGQMLVYEIGLFPLPNSCVCVMYEDVSERRRTENALRQSEGRLRTLMANFPMMVYSIDRNGIITMSEGKGLEAVGLAPGQTVGQSILDMYTEYPQIVASLRRALAGEQVSFMLDMGSLTFESIYTPLRDSNGEVEGMLGISTDITERRRTEELIRSQAETLQELSTPMLAIRDGVVVMPLVGAIDSRRAQQIMASVLEGVGTYRATTAIIDITGVSVVDTQVANALVRAAQAVKLLGAQAVLTGIRPEVAQTLVQLGVDLSSIITRGTLQAGIAYAIDQR